MRRFASCFLALGLSACAAQESQRPATKTPAPSSEVRPGQGPAAEQPAAQAETRPGPSPLLDERVADPAHALPRLSYKNIGLHVGGGNGSADEREALLHALG